MRRSETGIGEFQPPRDDLNAPDLYIPSAPSPLCHTSSSSLRYIPLAMAFVTYILVAALQSGLQSRFHPEIFGVVATKAIVVLVLDFLLVKGGCYLLGIQGTNPIVDLISYSGYKFVGCVVALTNSSTKLTPLQRDHNTSGWTGWVFSYVILNCVCLHLFSQRVFPRTYPVYLEFVQLTYLS